MDDITVSDQPSLGRYEIRSDGELIGFAEYVATPGGPVRFFHTEVASSWEGKGIGSQLIAFAMADMAQRGERVIPSCWFVDTWLRRHPELSGLRA